MEFTINTIKNDKGDELKYKGNPVRQQLLKITNDETENMCSCCILWHCSIIRRNDLNRSETWLRSICA